MVKLRIRELLEEKKISKSRLSRMSDVSLNTIQIICKDPSHDAVLSTIEKLAKSLGVPLSSLYEVEP